MADGGFDIGSLVAGANPYGAAIEAGTGAIKGITEAVAAAQQMKRAQDLRDQANRVTTEAIRPEYLQSQRNAQYQSLYGLAGLQGYQDRIGQNIAGSIRAIKESSPNGESTLAAISNTLANGNNAYNDLAGKDAQAQEKKSQYANNLLWNVGDKQRALEDIRDKQKLALQSQAGNLETAGTLNKQTGINDALGGITQGASQAFKMGTGTPDATSTSTPSTGGNYDNRTYGASASPYSGMDNTNLSGSNQTIQTTSTPSNQYSPWASYSLY